MGAAGSDGVAEVKEAGGPGGGVALALYVVLALVYTFPLVMRMTTHVPGDNGDSIHNLWGFWYFPRVWFLEGGAVWHPVLQFYPDGVNLAFTTSSFVGAILMTPVSLLLGAPFALNLWLLLHLALGGWLIYRLCRELRALGWAAFFGGMAYMWSPFIASHLPGHYTLAQIGYPAGCLYLLAAMTRWAAEGRGRGAAGGALGLGVCVAAMLVTDFYLSMMTILVLLPATWAHLAFQYGGRVLRSGLYWKCFGLAVVTAGVVFAPWPLYIFRSMQGHDYGVFAAALGTNKVLEWSRLVNLPPYHYLWRPLIYGNEVRELSVYNEYAYVGVVALFFGAVGLLWVDRPYRAIVWVVAFFLALGFGGGNSLTPKPEWSTGPLAFGKYWPTFFPFVEFRVPSRWHFALCAVVAIMLAVGSHALLTRFTSGRRRVFLVALPVLLLLDLSRWPLPVFDARPMESELDAAALAHPQGVALDFPVGLNTGTGNGWGDWQQGALMRQMSHGMKSFSGHVSRHANDVIAARKADEDFQALVAAQSGEAVAAEALERDWAGFARRLNVAAVRIPNDMESSATLRAIAERMNPQWVWHEGAEEMVAY